MFHNYLKIAFRNLRKNRLFTTLNIVGMGVGMAAVALMGLYIARELSYDRFYANADRIVRVVQHATWSEARVVGVVTDFRTYSLQHKIEPLVLQMPAPDDGDNRCVRIRADVRTKDGVRKVLGASVASIVALLSTDFLKLIGIAIALPTAWYLTGLFAGAGLLAAGIAFIDGECPEHQGRADEPGQLVEERMK